MAEQVEVAEFPATTLRRMVGSKQLSPVELVDACIARIEPLDPFVIAMAATDFDAACDAA